jgi:hypothetical protein
VVGVGERVVSAGLVVGLPEVGGQLEGLVEVGECGLWVSGGVVEAA